MDDLISVIVPIYNVEEYLIKCIKSIINQTYQNLEILLIDDGSTDNCLKICNNLQKNDNRIRVYHKSNGGLSDARNYGVVRASGKYVCFVDSDDYIDAAMIEKLYMKIKKENADVCSCDVIAVSSNQESKVSRKYMSKMIDDVYYGNGFVWNKMYKKKLIENILFDTTIHIYEDLLFNYTILAKKEVKYTFIKDPLYYYIQRNGSIMHSNYIQKKLYSLEVTEKIISILKSINNMHYLEYECRNLGNILKLYKHKKQSVDLEKHLTMALDYVKYDLKYSKLNFKGKVKLLLFKIKFRNKR